MIAKSFGARRAGAISLATLVTLPLLLLLAGLVVYVCLLRDAHTESQNGADAAALAAALALATDDLLVENDPARVEKWLARSHDAALALGHANFAGGERLDLARDGAVAFGHLDGPLSATFAPFDPAAKPTGLPTVNAARVTVRRSPVRAPLGGATPDKDLRARATAMLDRSVVGFRPKDAAPIPLMPVAIFTDHDGKLPNGWDANLAVARAAGDKADAAAFDAAKNVFAPGPDGIPEVTAIIGPRDSDDGETAPAAVFLRVGTDSFAETVRQVGTGVPGDALKNKNAADFILGVDNTLHIPGTPECPAAGTRGRERLDDAFVALRDSGAARVWPLYEGVTGGAVRVTGWTAARVVSVSAAGGGGVKLVLQPAVVCHPAVVTERRDPPPKFWANNRTVCRVRLAD